MAASERLSLLLEARTTGEQDLARMEQRINSVIALAQKSSETQGKAATAASAATDKAAQQLSNFASQLKASVTDPFGQASNKVESFALSFGKLGAIGIAAGAGIGLVGTALISMARDLGKSAEQLANFADRLDLSIEQASRLKDVADIVGVEVGSLEGGVRKLSEALEDSSGAGEASFKALQKLGVAVFDTTGKQRQLGSVIYESIEALSKVESASLRASLGTEILGKGFKGFAPAIKNFQEVSGELSRQLIQTTSETNSTFAKLDDQFGFLEKRVINLKKLIVEPLAGGLSDFIQNLLSIGIPQGTSGKRTDIGGGSTFVAPLSIFPNVTTTGAAARSAFQLSEAGTETGLARQIKEKGDAIEKARQQLNSELDSSARESITREFRRLEAEKSGLEDRLARMQREKAERRAQIEKFAKLEVESLTLQGPRNTNVPRLLRRGEQVSLTPGGQFVIDESDIAKANEGLTASQSGIANAQAVGLANRGNPSGERDLAIQQQALNFQERKIELLTGPGGELAAIQSIARLRLDALDREREITGDNFDLAQRRRQIEIDTELQVLSIRRGALNTGRDQLFSLGTGQTSVGQFARNTALTIGKNVFNKAYDFIGPQLGKFGASSGLGSLLSGTAFDPAQDGNTRATDRNTNALDRLTSTISIGGGGTSSIGGGIFGGGASNGGFGSIFSFLGLGKKSAAAGGGSSPTLSEDDELQAILGSSGTSRLAKGIGIAGAGAAGAFGIYSGIKQGGLRGGLTAGGSGAGALAAILPLIGVSGPAAPILAGIALGAEVIKSLLPDPKVARDKRINSTLDSSFYQGPSSSTYSEDIYGRQSYYDKTGRAVPVNVTFNVQAMDSKSFLDRRGDISDAVKLSMQEAHAINTEIQSVAFAY